MPVLVSARTWRSGPLLVGHLACAREYSVEFALCLARVIENQPIHWHASRACRLPNSVN